MICLVFLLKNAFVAFAHRRHGNRAAFDFFQTVSSHQAAQLVKCDEAHRFMEKHLAARPEYAGQVVGNRRSDIRVDVMNDEVAEHDIKRIMT